MKYIIINILILISIGILSCRRFIDIGPPPNQLVNTSVFNDLSSADAAVTGIYSKMMESLYSNTFPNGYCTVLGGISSDELVYLINGNTVSPDYRQIAENEILPGNLELQNFWNQAYSYINAANAIIDGLNNSTALDPQQKSQLEGEALFVRAWCHYWLMSFFGGIPYITSANYNDNLLAKRPTVTEDMDKMIKDFKLAENQLNDTELSGFHLRPIRAAARAMLAKLYLELKDWQNAYNYSNTVISNNQFQLTSSTEDIFNKHSSETIWQFQPLVPPNYTIQEAAWFVPLAGSNLSTAVSDDLLAAFEAGDTRKQDWLDSIQVVDKYFYYPKKYRINGQLNEEQYYIVLRLTEQFFIRAEARLNLNDPDGTLSDINLIRNRASLPLLQNNDIDFLRQALLKERRVEFFAEWGMRWIDLKRSGNIDNTMSAIKGSHWQTNDQLYPVPQSEILADPALIQNPGY